MNSLRMSRHFKTLFGGVTSSRPGGTFRRAPTFTIVNSNKNSKNFYSKNSNSKKNILFNSIHVNNSSRQHQQHLPLPLYVWISVGGTTALLGYSYFAFLDQVPLTGRKRWIATSPAWEQHMGDQEYRNLMATFGRDILPPSHLASQTVARVGARIAQTSADFSHQYHVQHYPAHKPYTYTVVRNDTTANAFVLPGNHIFVFTGLFPFAPTEDDLAAVLGHEAAHNVARHAGEKISGSLLVNLLARLSLLLDPSGLFLAIFLPATAVLRELPHSRIQEMEADLIGIRLAAAACYDPRAATRVFKAMKQAELQHAGSASRPPPPEFLSTHPSHDSRLANLQKSMPDAMRLYQQQDNKCATIRQQMALARQAAALQL